MNKISMYATPEEVKMFSSKSQYSVCEIKFAQIYALYTIAEWKRSQIADLLEYAVSTVSRKRQEMCCYEDLANEIFIELSIIETVEQVATATIENVLYRHFKDGRPAVAMELMENCGVNLKNEQAAYFFKFYNAEELLFNKIGTTAKDIIARLRREIGDYSEKFDITRVEIHRMRSCGDIPAEGAESALRAEFIKRYPTAFRKNDRFFGVNISPEDFDAVYSKYFI
jgi:hypothetical protein